MSNDDLQIAHCTCGQLRAECRGEAPRISICHCLACKRRTGGSFGHNVTFPEAQVSLSGRFVTYRRISDDGGWADSSFCPTCGSTVFYRIEVRPGMVSIAGGAFEDPLSKRLAPGVEIYEERRQPWCHVDLSHPKAEEG